MFDTPREVDAFLPETSWDSIALAYGILAFQVRSTFNHSAISESE
jgi:hypothetical protein